MTIAGYVCGVIVAVAMIALLIWYMKPPKEGQKFVTYMGELTEDETDGQKENINKNR